MRPEDYEFIISVIDIGGTLTSRLDTSHHGESACAAYDVSVNFDVEAGFKQGRISALLQDEVLTHMVQQIHQTAKLAWLHPGDDEGIMSEWEAGQPGGNQYVTPEQKQCALQSCLYLCHIRL
jgi:hypothetical protein